MNYYLNHNTKEKNVNLHLGLRSTLLLPKSQFELFINYQLSINEFRKTEKVIKRFIYLIETKQIIIKPNIFKHTTLYQNSKRDLQKINFVCDPMVWHHWKRLSNCFGVSMCYLFALCCVKLSKLDSKLVGTHNYNIIFQSQNWYEKTNYEEYTTERTMMISGIWGREL